jgi:hypothetical protein
MLDEPTARLSLTSTSDVVTSSVPSTDDIADDTPANVTASATGKRRRQNTGSSMLSSAPGSPPQAPPPPRKKVYFPSEPTSSSSSAPVLPSGPQRDSSVDPTVSSPRVLRSRGAIPPDAPIPRGSNMSGGRARGSVRGQAGSRGV